MFKLFKRVNIVDICRNMESEKKNEPVQVLFVSCALLIK